MFVPANHILVNFSELVLVNVPMKYVHTLMPLLVALKKSVMLHVRTNVVLPLIKDPVAVWSHKEAYMMGSATVVVWNAKVH
jgi:hypothetical protein